MAKGCTKPGGLKGYFAGLLNPILLLSLAMQRESIVSFGIENVNTTVEQALRQQLFFQNRAAVGRWGSVALRASHALGFRAATHVIALVAADCGHSAATAA